MPPEAGLLEKLRAATRPLHAQLDESSSLTRLLDPRITRAQYLATLQALYGLVLPLERKLLRELPVWRSSYQFVARSPCLREDIEALGGAPVMTSRAGVVPDLQSVAEWFGMAYVLEGSRLGGLVLAKRLRGTLGLENNEGLAYFSSCGENVRTTWQGFLEELGAQEEDLPAEEVLEKATATFSVFARELH